MEEPSSGALYETLATEALERYEDREETLTPEIMRQVERQIMMRLIDQRWRDHLYEMDYLREGIHLRAMGQRDPAMEWQREGFEMFGQMMNSIDSEFVRYIMHVEIKAAELAPDGETPEDGGEGKAEGKDDAAKPQPVGAQGAPIVDATATKADASAAGAKPAIATAPLKMTESSSAPTGKAKVAEAPPQPKLNNEFENVGRNAPCPCGSGKKFKHCHGR